MDFTKIKTFSIDDTKYYLTPLSDAIYGGENIQSNYSYWFGDPVVTKYNSHGLFPFNPMDSIDEFMKDKTQIVWSILARDIIDDNYTHIGNISLQKIDMMNRSAEIAIVIGEPEYYGKGIATKALEYLIDHGFNKLGLNRIWSGTAATNKGMQRVFRKLGFDTEGVFKQGMFLNGEFVDVIAYGKLNNNIYVKKYIPKNDDTARTEHKDPMNVKYGPKFPDDKFTERFLDDIKDESIVDTIENMNKEIELDIDVLTAKHNATELDLNATNIDDSDFTIDMDGNDTEQIINRMSLIRSQNNINWMDIVRLAFEYAPEKAKEILCKISVADQKVNDEVQNLIKGDYGLS